MGPSLRLPHVIWALAAIFLAHPLSTAHAQAIVDGGFETGSADIGPIPTTFGTWAGDGSAYVTATSGITPFEGSRMLQFLTTHQGSGASTDVTSQYHQNVDLSSFSASIALGQAVLSASAMFNRVLGDAQTDTEFGLNITAKSGTPSAFTDLGTVSSVLFSDGDPATWQQLSINDFTLPAGTTFVMLEIVATENIFNDTSGVEFDGHFADDVSLNVNIVPEPGSLLLLASAGGFAARRWRRSGPHR